MILWYGFGLLLSVEASLCPLSLLSLGKSHLHWFDQLGPWLPVPPPASHSPLGFRALSPLFHNHNSDDQFVTRLAGRSVLSPLGINIQPS